MAKTRRTVSLQQQISNFSRRHRDPRMLLAVIIWFIVLIFLTIEASSGREPGPLEESLFWFINGWPEFLWPFFYAITQLGAVFIVPVAAVGALLTRRYKLTFRILVAGFGAWGVAKLMKELIERGRPAEFYEI